MISGKIMAGTVAVLVLLTGCNKDYGIGNREYNYITCKGNYANFKNEKIKKYLADSANTGLEVTLENGNVIYVSLENCFISKDAIE